MRAAYSLRRFVRPARTGATSLPAPVQTAVRRLSSACPRGLVAKRSLVPCSTPANQPPVTDGPWSALLGVNLPALTPPALLTLFRRWRPSERARTRPSTTPSGSLIARPPGRPGEPRSGAPGRADRGGAATPPPSGGVDGPERPEPRPARAREVVELTISDSVRRQLETILARTPSPLHEPDAALEVGWAAQKKFPAALSKALLPFTGDPAAPGVLIIHNAPIDPRLPPTPTDGGPSSEKRTHIAEGMLLAVARHAGEPGTFHGLKPGLIHDVAPVPGGEDTQSNEGSRRRFGFHTESAFSEHRPSHVALICLRTDHEGVAETTFASARAACKRLPPETLAILRKPLFTTRAPESFKEAHRSGQESTAVPVVLGEEGAVPELRLNFQSTKGVGDEAQAALDALKEALEHPDVRFSVKLRPGDLVLFDNRKLVHGRSSFQPRFDGTDRWLMRAYVLPTWEARGGDPEANPRFVAAAKPPRR